MKLELSSGKDAFTLRQSKNPPDGQLDCVDISVIVTNWNNGPYLEHCVRSVLGQSLRNLEVIIVDDGSSDDSRDIIARLASEDPRIHPILQSNRGFGAAANTGIDAARGEFIAFVDSDDYLAIDMYKTLWEVAVANNLDIARGDHLNIEGSGAQAKTELFSVAPPEVYGQPIRPRDYVARALTGQTDIFRVFGYIWDCIYRRSFLINNGIRVNEGVSSHNDVGFYFQSIALAERFQFVRAANYFHRTDNPQQSMRDEKKLFQNYFIEHRFLEARFHELGIWDEFRDLILRREYSNYVNVLNRISFELQGDFVQLASRALAEHSPYFGNQTFLPWQGSMARLLVSDPDAYLVRWREAKHPAGKTQPTSPPPPVVTMTTTMTTTILPATATNPSPTPTTDPPTSTPTGSGGGGGG